MKKKIVILLLLVVICSSFTSAYSFEEFIDDAKNFFLEFSSITGMVVAEMGGEKIETQEEKFEKIKIPEPKEVELAKKTKEKGQEDKKSFQGATSQNKAEKPIEKETTEQEIEISTEEESIEEVIEPTIQEETQLKEKETKKSKRTKRVKPTIHIPECSDYADNNVNYYKKGVCKDESKKRINQGTEDYCSNDGITLMEYYCGSTGFCEGSWYVCANGCKDGTCLTEKEEELKPDLKVLSLINKADSSLVSVKNTGTKGTYFKTKINTQYKYEISEVDYYLEPGEVVEVNLGEKITGDYSVGVISEEDENQQDNILKGHIEEPKSPEVNQHITGAVTTELPQEQDVEENKKDKKPIFARFIEFLKNIF
ncbi:hypothetical protein ISS04_03805 [Candidatus Woesearchaeota archaeon]|nr:hypothetical protein [Candidatus Woesearchaeota archaeon]